MRLLLAWKEFQPSCTAIHEADAAVAVWSAGLSRHHGKLQHGASGPCCWLIRDVRSVQ